MNNCEIKFVFEITVPLIEKFKNKRHNLRMINAIKRWVEDGIIGFQRQWNNIIPFYIRERGETIEYESGKVVVKMLSCDILEKRSLLPEKKQGE